MGEGVKRMNRLGVKRRRRRRPRRGTEMRETEG